MADELPPPKHFALMAAGFEGGLVVVAVGLGWLLDTPPLETFRWDGAQALLALAATLPLLLGLLVCVKWPVGPLGRLVRVIDDLFLPLLRNCRGFELAVIAGLAGLGEEMLFRGVIQTVVERWVEPWVGQPSAVWIALGAAAVLFGLAHRITNTYAVLAGLIGLYLGWLWLVTGNLLVPILIHAVYDLLALIYLVKLR